MADNRDYVNIGPFDDLQTAEATTRLAEHPLVSKVSEFIFPDQPEDALKQVLFNVKSVDDFQEMVMDQAVKRVLDTTSDGLTYEGIENLKGLDGRFLAVSNHRDIIIDPAITQYVLLHNGIPLTQIAVGDNLISSEAVEMLFRCNRSIKVVRGLPVREMYNASKILSAYIRNSIVKGESSVWIAQRQGRAKDGNDRTAQGLLKMFDMSGEGSFTENFALLNLVPLSISYEYDSCDILKARELLISSTEGSYVKKPGEDMNSILTGVMQKKGRIHFCVGKPISAEELETAAQGGKNDRYQHLCDLMDRRIILGYKLWKTNYIAYDLVHRDDKYSSEYTPQEMVAFADYVEKSLDKVEKTLDRDRLREIFLGIYSNPVVSRENLL